MLMQLGLVQFEIAPVNIEEHERAVGHDFAEHAVVGTAPVLESVGPQNDVRRLRGKMFPFNGLYANGPAGLDAIYAMTASGQSQPLLRGDGRPLGFFVITHAHERNSYLHSSGVGKVIEFEIGLKRDKPPGPAALLAMLVSMFA